MPYLRPASARSGVAALPRALPRSAGVLPTTNERVGGVMNLGSRTIGAIDQYIRNSNDLQAQTNLFEVTSAYQAERLAQEVSSGTATTLLQLLRTRLAVAASDAERATIEAQVAKFADVQRLAAAREATRRKVAWGVGLAVVVALAAGGGWYYYKHRG